MSGNAARCLHTQRKPCGKDGGTITCVWIPEERRSKEKWGCFTREVEKLVYGTDRCASNVLRDMEQLGLDGLGRLYKHVGNHGIMEADWKALIHQYNSMKK